MYQLLKRSIGIHAFAVFLLAFGSLSAHALVIPNPAPAAFGDDIRGSGLFTATGPGLISLRVSDTGFDLGLGGAEFGMFFESAPGTLIPIFLATNQDTSTPRAISLATGQIFEGGSEVLTFTPNTGPFGFYLTPSPTLQTVFGVSSIFTVPSLNPLDEDMAAAFPILGTPDGYLFGFGAIDPSNPSSVVPLGYAAVVNIAPELVPEPATLPLLLLGLAGWLVLVRARKAAGS
jgi:hypothetical protein